MAVFFNNLFGKKIVLTPEMKIMAESLIENEWFRACGQQSIYNTEFKVEIAGNIGEVEKKLAYKRDVKDFVTLDNLLIEAGLRSQLFLSLHHKNEMQHTWNNLSDIIVKEYISSQKFNFDLIQNNFNSLLGVQTDLYLRRVFINTLKEVYFKDFIEGYPTFLSKVIDIYLKGNVIIGWIGKFGSHEVQVKEISPISPKDGVVNIW